MMARILNGPWGEVRPSPREPQEYKAGDVIKIENKSGDIAVFTPKEVRTILQEYIIQELEFFSDEVVRKNRSKVTERIDFKLKQLENSLVQHIDAKFLKIEEKIIEDIIDRKIEEEVTKRLEIKLKNYYEKNNNWSNAIYYSTSVNWMC